MGRLSFMLVVAVALVACAKAPPPAPANTDWDLLGNSPEQQHHSDLSQINRATVGRLGLAWSADIPSTDGLVGNPLVKDGVVYQSGARGRIFANDVRTGKPLWVYEALYEFTAALNTSWGGRYNRGLALAEGLAIVATGDCRLIAVDQKTGKKAWEVQACDPQQMYSMTAAPRVGGGMVFIGNACLDSGATRGYVDAYDAKTGKRAWRFYTVPGDPALPPENEVYAMAAKTWG
ncbi:MAG: PQQ-binding-like beta-propeller repeat protein, partial [Dehalococcoidia bacterium]